MEDQDKETEPRETDPTDLLSRGAIEAIITKRLRHQRTEVIGMTAIACLALVEAIGYAHKSTETGAALSAAVACGLGLLLPAVKSGRRFFEEATTILRTQKPVRTVIIDIRRLRQNYYSSYDVYLVDHSLGRPAGEHDRRPGSLPVHTTSNKNGLWERHCADGDGERAAALSIPADVYIDQKSGNCVAIVVSDDLAWRVCKL